MAKSSAKEKLDTNCPACVVQFHRSIRLLTLPLTDLAGAEHRRAYHTLACVLRDEVLRTPGDVKHHIYYLTTSRGAQLPVAGGKYGTTRVHGAFFLKKRVSADGESHNLHFSSERGRKRHGETL